MSQPITRKSIDGATAVGEGSDVRSLGHHNLTLFVVASNLDAANDTLDVSLEASPNRTNWDGVASLAASDFSEDPDNAGVYTAHANVSGEYYEHLRAHVTGFVDAASGDLSADAWVMAGGYPGQGRKGTRRSGAISP